MNKMKLFLWMMILLAALTVVFFLFKKNAYNTKKAEITEQMFQNIVKSKRSDLMELIEYLYALEDHGADWLLYEEGNLVVKDPYDLSEETLNKGTELLSKVFENETVTVRVVPTKHNGCIVFSKRINVANNPFRKSYMDIYLSYFPKYGSYIGSKYDPYIPEDAEWIDANFVISAVGLV